MPRSLRSVVCPRNTFAWRLLTSGIVQPRAANRASIAVDDRLVDFHRQPERLRQRLARQVILGRPEAAGDDQEIGAVERVADLRDEVGERDRRRSDLRTTGTP